MQILGHSQISLTVGSYSHVVPELAYEAAERMAGVLWSDESSEPGGLAATLAAQPDDEGEGRRAIPPLA